MIAELTNPSQDAEPAEAEGSLPALTSSESGSSGASRNTASLLLSGTSALGAGVILERGFGFLANLLAARIGGASTFGAYSLAIATANNIGTYAAGGIGATAIRFSGKYPRGSSGYPTLSKVLLIVSLASAALASLALWIGAAPIAGLLGKQSLTGLLRWAAFSAGGMILVECCRGFLIGQRRLKGLLVLSLAVGGGMLALLPLASRLGPIQMVASQGAVTTAAVLFCLFLARPLGITAPSKVAHPPKLAPILGEVWLFTLIQLAGVVGMNAAGWWLTSLVARADVSMIQMGFYAIANQLRNIVGLAPSLLSQSSLAAMAESSSDHDQTPDEVMAVCAFVSTFISFALAGVGMLLAPWILGLLYGRSYTMAAAATVLSLATAVIQMGNGPAAGRLTIVSIKSSGIINTVWALVVAAAATLLLLNGGSAATAAAIIFGAHVLSASLVLLVLRTKSKVPSGMSSLFLTSTGGSILLSALTICLGEMPSLANGLALAALVTFGAGLTGLFLIGRKHRWIPSRAALDRLFHRSLDSLRVRLHLERPRA